MPDTLGFGTESGFLGARDEESRLEGFTSSATCEFGVDVHEVGEIFGLFIFGGVGSLLGRV